VFLKEFFLQKYPKAYQFHANLLLTLGYLKHSLLWYLDLYLFSFFLFYQVLVYCHPCISFQHFPNITYIDIFCKVWSFILQLFYIAFSLYCWILIILDNPTEKRDQCRQDGWELSHDAGRDVWVRNSHMASLLVFLCHDNLYFPAQSHNLGKLNKRD
jgi:hypothetical protein